ncbi:MAG: hypothetical protein RMJ67_01175 [Elusimicrobiota bacterium]|nr:hypothetical protein [Endomicrobiia bacterium]MDW8165115.1 hypothetical protein [Elusimicrobiota bacterium]
MEDYTVNSKDIVYKLGEIATKYCREASINPATKDFVNVFIYPQYGIKGTSSSFEKAQAILDFVQRYFRVNYERDAFFAEQINHPVELMQRYIDYYIKGNQMRIPIGDCDDLATLYCALVESVGIRSVFVFPAYRPHGASSNSKKPNHIACAVGIQDFGQDEPLWYIADPTSQLPLMRKDDYEKKVGQIIYVLPKRYVEPDGTKFLVIPRKWA